MPQERKQWKWSLVRRLFERGYSREDIVRLFRLIDWMMVLPEELQREFKEELRRYQEESQMPLLSRIELEAKQEGIEEGRQQGLEEGILQNAHEMAHLRPDKGDKGDKGDFNWSVISAVFKRGLYASHS